MLKKIILVLLCFFYISCNDTKQNETEVELESTKVTSDTKIVNSICETLNDESRKLVESWPEYKIVDETITDYYTITPGEALLKAKDLSNYAQQLKDSIRIELFDRPDLKIRLNVLYNTSLRLADMETIESIKTEEVTSEINNIVSAFSAINSKINNIINQENLEKELLNFEKNSKN